MQFLHAHSVVHLDIKPENLLFSELGAVRVGDLGCASHVAEVFSQPDRRYMALSGLEDEVTPSRDVFSLGLVVRECMTHEAMPTNGELWLRLRRDDVGEDVT